MPKFHAARQVQPAREPEAASAPSPEVNATRETPISCEASVGGIVQCLRMLAEEATSLGLAGTAWVLRMAIAICEREGAEAPQRFATIEPIHSVARSVN